MAKRRYKFTGKRQSGWGIASTVAGVAALIMTVSAAVAAYMQSGQAGRIIGVLGFVALFLSVLGMYYGIRGIRQEDVYRLFPWMGFVINWMILAVFVMIYILGW